jgi:NAD(P)-dependent dehydrogenase (short-subunit alcohol dehydrogenase family)
MSLSPESVASSSAEEFRRQLFDLEGRGAVVTGGASGLGLAMARALASFGAIVTIVDVREDALRTAQEALAADGLTVHTSTADISDFASIEEAMAAAEKRAGALHIAFANAGITAGNGPFVDEGTLRNIDDERWKRVLDVNLTGALNTIRAAEAHMTTGYGRIVVTSSVAGIAAEPLVGYAYAASKSAVIALVRNAAIELAPRGILVNAIAPGSFTTNLGQPGPDRQRKLDALRLSTVLRRMADPAELGGMAVYLASPASSYVTGSVFAVDGGASVARNTSVMDYPEGF